MAETFKNLPSPVLVASTKPASERDFFDLSDDSQPAKISVVTPTVDPKLNNTGNTIIPGKTSNASSMDNSSTNLKSGRAEKKGNTSNTDNPGITGNDSKNGNTTSWKDLDRIGAATLVGDVR